MCYVQDEAKLIEIWSFEFNIRSTKFEYCFDLVVSAVLDINYVRCSN